MEPYVADAPENGRYEIRDGDRMLGQAAYQRSDNRIVFTHTEVEDSAEHSGLGGRLVRAALDDVRGRGERVVPMCSFVRGWIERHPEYRDLVDSSAER